MGALHGVPIALKDIFDAAGVPTAVGRARLGHADPGGGRAVGRGAARRGRGADGQARHHALRLPRSRRSRAIRGIPSTRPAAPRAAPPPRWPRAWCRWRSDRRRWARCCGRPRTAASSGSSPPTAGSARRGCSSWPGASTTWGCSRGRWRTARSRLAVLAGGDPAPDDYRRRGDRPAGAPPRRARLVPGARDARDGQAPGSGHARPREPPGPGWRTWPCPTRSRRSTTWAPPCCARRRRPRTPRSSPRTRPSTRPRSRS